MRLKKVAVAIDWAWEEYMRKHHEKERRRKRYASKRKYRAKREKEL